MHKLTIVLVPLTATDLEASVSALLDGSAAAPDKVFPEYSQPCLCIGGNSVSVSYAQVDHAPEYAELRQEIQEARSKLDKDLERRLMWQRRVVAKALMEAHPLFGKPEPDCDACNGTGLYTTSRDPELNWDYWIIGGGWDGVLEPFNKASVGSSELLKQNCAPVAELPQTFVPFAIVTPEGFWYQTGSRWIGMEGDSILFPEEQLEIDQWAKECRELFDRYQEFLAVAVDCHS